MNLILKFTNAQEKSVCRYNMPINITSKWYSSHNYHTCFTRKDGFQKKEVSAFSNTNFKNQNVITEVYHNPLQKVNFKSDLHKM